MKPDWHRRDKLQKVYELPTPPKPKIRTPKRVKHPPEPNWEGIDDHTAYLYFMEYLKHLPPHKNFADYSVDIRCYNYTHFNTWATTNKLPRERWDAVFGNPQVKNAITDKPIYGHWWARSKLDGIITIIHYHEDGGWVECFSARMHADDRPEGYDFLEYILDYADPAHAVEREPLTREDIRTRCPRCHRMFPELTVGHPISTVCACGYDLHGPNPNARCPKCKKVIEVDYEHFRQCGYDYCPECNVVTKTNTVQGHGVAGRSLRHCPKCTHNFETICPACLSKNIWSNQCINCGYKLKPRWEV